MKYTAIADVGKKLIALLKNELVPEIINKSDSIGLCSPDNKSDFLLGVHLYSIEQSDGVRISSRQHIDLYTQKYPPVVLDLLYMITPYYKSNVKFLAEEEQNLLGKIIQILNDNSIITSESGEQMTLEICNPSLDDRQKIWNSSSTYRTSLFFAVRTVVLESARSKEVARVTDISITTKQQ